jgi:hypothetical protein
MTQTALPGSPHLPPAWPKDALRIGFGVIWAIDAALKWSPEFRSGYPGYLTSAATVRPSRSTRWTTCHLPYSVSRALGLAFRMRAPPRSG